MNNRKVPALLPGLFSFDTPTAEAVGILGNTLAIAKV